MTDSPVLQRVRELVEPIASDLGLDLYDVEQRGGTLRVTIDTPPGSPGGVDMDQLALATRLISREMDHDDPMPGRYTLEVTSPGVERTLRTPAHFQREIGKTINVRLADTDAERRRFEGVLIAADETTATIRLDDDELSDTVVDLADIDRARTVFVWGPQPKPGGKGASKKNKQQSASSPSQQASPSKKETS
jgi:ribosome maturation factor RimP